MTVYDTWLADPTRDRIVLAEVQPAEQLGAFSATSVAVVPTRISASGHLTGLFATPISTGLTIAAGTRTNLLLVVRIMAKATSVDTVAATISGSNYSLTKHGGATNGLEHADIWYLKAPVDSATIVTVTVTGTGTTDLALEASVWYNVDQTTPFSAIATQSATTNAPALSVTSTVTSSVLDVLRSSASDTATIGGSQVSDSNSISPVEFGRCATSHLSGSAGTTSMSWSLSGSHALAYAGAAMNGSAIIYSVAWSNYAQTSVVKGGIYRRLDAVRENGTAYSLVASTTLIASTASSYYFDSSASLLYVHTSTGSSPNTFDFIGAWFTIFLATADPEFVLDTTPLYEPRLTGQLPQLRTTKPDELFGASVWAEGTIEMANADALFDALARSWIWENKVLTVKVGGTGLALTDYLTLRTMRVASINVDDQLATLSVQAMADILTRSLPPNTVAGLGIYIAGLGFLIDDDSPVWALTAPWIYGSIEDVPMKELYDDGAAFATYLVRDASLDPFLGYPIYLLTALYAINTTTGVRLTLSTAGDVNDVLADGIYELVANYAYRESQGYELRADITYITGAGTGIGTMAKSVLLMCGESSANIDSTAFTNLDTAVPYTVAFCLSELTPASEVMRNIEQSGLVQVYVGTDGRWTCRALDPAATVVASLTDEDFATWKATVEDQSVLSEARVQYELNPSSSAVREVSTSDTATAAGRETSDSHRVLTYLRLEADAQELCDRYAFIKQRAHALIESQQRTLGLINAMPGDLVSVTRTRAAARTGAYSAVPVLLRETQVTLGPTIKVETVLDDLGEVLTLVGVYSDDTGADWSTATAAQKQSLAFYADDNGFIDSSDAATRHRKVYW